MFEAIEKFSVVKTLQSISEANVVVLLLDAQQDISEQDAHIAGFILESGPRAGGRRQQVGRPDSPTSATRSRSTSTASSTSCRFAKTNFISALKGTGINQLMKSVDTRLCRRHRQAVDARA